MITTEYYNGRTKPQLPWPPPQPGSEAKQHSASCNPTKIRCIAAVEGKGQLARLTCLSDKSKSHKLARYQHCKQSLKWSRRPSSNCQCISLQRRQNRNSLPSIASTMVVSSFIPLDCCINKKTIFPVATTRDWTDQLDHTTSTEKSTWGSGYKSKCACLRKTTVAMTHLP